MPIISQYKTCFQFSHAILNIDPSQLLGSEKKCNYCNTGDQIWHIKIGQKQHHASFPKPMVIQVGIMPILAYVGLVSNSSTKRNV